jgi:fumarate reductase (CoM/CoB) subunit A
VQILLTLEFNQYYGTDLIWPPSVKGAVVLYELMIDEFADGRITDKDGNSIMDKPLPIRDDAIKIIYKVIKEGRGTEHGGVYFDTTKSPKGEAAVRDVFKNMTPKHYQFLIDAAGLDLAKTPLEVGPASHYQCGGIYINERGESSVKGLYAAGECAGNFQGANRLAGSALCDTQTMGAQAGGCAADDAKKWIFCLILEKEVKEKWRS